MRIEHKPQFETTDDKINFEKNGDLGTDDQCEYLMKYGNGPREVFYIWDWCSEDGTITAKYRHSGRTFITNLSLIRHARECSAACCAEEKAVFAAGLDYSRAVGQANNWSIATKKALTANPDDRSAQDARRAAIVAIKTMIANRPTVKQLREEYRRERREAEEAAYAASEIGSAEMEAEIAAEIARTA